MEDVTDLFVSSVVYQETIPAGEAVEEPFLRAEDPWSVRMEYDIPSSHQALDYVVDMDPLPVAPAKEKRKQPIEDLRFLTYGGVAVNFVEVDIDLPPNAQFLRYPKTEDAYGLEVVVQFGA